MSQDARYDEEQSTQKRAQILGFNYVDTSQIINKTLYKELLPLQSLYQLRVIPITVTKGNILFGITTTTSQQTMRWLEQQFADSRVNFAIISENGYGDYLKLYDPPKQVVYQDISLSTAGTDDLVRSVTKTLEEIRPDDTLAYLVQQAYRLNSSDIHIESQRDDVRFRFRIDGVLHLIATITKERYRILLSVIASAGNISTSEPEAQQGHISQRVKMADGNEVDVNVRLEAVPTVNGMDVVMRLFNMKAENYHLDRLGLSVDERQIVDSIISKPTGLVLIVGPTGSGKTTTLYSILNALNTEERKIITVEDPVEYQFPGIVQIPAVADASGNDGSFARKLRAILRLDPDVVMVGEIRDNDTARTALQASMTGHLVLSTFHASSAAAALTRLEDVIGQNPLFVSAVRLIMAQRLVRKLDDTTKQQYVPDEATRAWIQRVVDTLPSSVPQPNLEGLVLYKPGNSPENPYGFSGQLALREQFIMTPEVRKLLENQNVVLASQEIEAAAIAGGMLTMLQKGVLKIIAGETTVGEVVRVIG